MRGFIQVLSVVILLSYSSHAAQLDVVTRAVKDPPGIAANGDSVAPMVDATGRFVVFSSTAANLVTGHNGTPAVQVYRHDRVLQKTELVSVDYLGNGCANSDSMHFNISSDGRFILFQSDASDLVPGDTNNTTDIFIRDTVASKTWLVSASITGKPAAGRSSDPVMSPDGNFVAYVSAAADIVTGDTNKTLDAFVWERSTGLTRRATFGTFTSGTTPNLGQLAITPDGRYLAFVSDLRGLVEGVTNTQSQIYVRDLLAGQTIYGSAQADSLARAWLSVTNPPTSTPLLSDDGNWLVFKTGPTTQNATNLLLVTDLRSNLTSIISSNAAPAWADADEPYRPVMSPDGRFVAFVEREGNDLRGPSSVRLWDRLASAALPVSFDAAVGYADGTISHTPQVSPDGRYVVFVSDASTIVTNQVVPGFHIYRRDTMNGVTMLVDSDPQGRGGTRQVFVKPAMSADGRVVAFCAPDGTLVDGDNNAMRDAFVRDMDTTQVELISRRTSGTRISTAAQSSLTPLSISADGRKVLFTSFAGDLTADAPNGELDVFVYDRISGVVDLVSKAKDGGPALGGASISGALSADGRFAVFSSVATNLTGGLTNYSLNVFRRDLVSGTTALVSVSTNGVTAGTGDSSVPAISADGRWVAFSSQSTDLVAGSQSGTIFLRDMLSNRTSRLPASVLSGGFGFGGQSIAYLSVSPSGKIQVAKLADSSSVFSASTSSATWSFSPLGTLLAYFPSAFTPALTIVDVVQKTNVMVLNVGTIPASPPSWGSEGNFLVITASTNFVPEDVNGKNDIYFIDVSTARVELLSRNANGNGSANGASDAPVISGDGRFVAFRTEATDMLPGLPPGQKFILLDRTTGTRSLIAAPNGGPQWNGRPVLSTDGSAMAFVSKNTGLVPGDLNFASDVFVATTQVTDSDGDGLDDAWEKIYFGSLLLDGTLDSDGDGLPDALEFRAGTNPLDPVSGMQIRLLPGDASNPSTFRLAWFTVPGRNYRVQETESLDNPQWRDAILGVVSVEGNWSVALMQISRDQNRYFRVLQQ